MGTGGSVTLDTTSHRACSSAGSRRLPARRHGAQPGRGQVQRVDELQERGFLGRSRAFRLLSRRNFARVNSAMLGNRPP
jgi:hypothetical protein